MSSKKKEFSVEHKNCVIKIPFAFNCSHVAQYDSISTTHLLFSLLFRIPFALVSLNSKACTLKLRNQYNDVASLYIVESCWALGTVLMLRHISGIEEFVGRTNGFIEFLLDRRVKVDFN